MTTFPLGARVRNIRTGELGTIVKPCGIPHFAANPDVVGCQYDGDDAVWDTPPAKIELLIVEDGQ